jgi:HlyD family secretion protein
MTANVRITTDKRDSVLKVPNSALRFRPPGEAATDAAKAGDKGGAPNADGADKSGASKGASGGGPGGAMTQFRDRLVNELKLDAQQQQRLDPIFAEARNKFMGLRDVPEEARAKQGAAIRADMRAKIEDILKPEQKEKYAQIVAESSGRPGGGQSARGRVYLLADGAPKAVEIRVGLSDGSMSEVSGDGLAEGADVIIGTIGGSSGNAPAQKGGPPRMFF